MHFVVPLLLGGLAHAAVQSHNNEEVIATAAMNGTQSMAMTTIQTLTSAPASIAMHAVAEDVPILIMKTREIPRPPWEKIAKSKQDDEDKQEDDDSQESTKSSKKEKPKTKKKPKKGKDDEELEDGDTTRKPAEEAGCQVSCKDQYRFFYTRYTLTGGGCGSIKKVEEQLHKAIKNACAVTGWTWNGSKTDWSIKFNCEIKKNGEVNKKIDEWGTRFKKNDFGFLARCD